MSFAQEAVQSGEKGQARYRIDKRVKRYLLAKRPPPRDDRLYNYRTEACVGHNEAIEDGADPDLIAFLRAEHDWALEQLLKYDPAALVGLGYDVPISSLQGDLFISPPSSKGGKP